MSVTTKKFLPRRTVLCALGVTIASPVLDAVSPALAAKSNKAGRPPLRSDAVFILDRIRVKPGELETYQRGLRERYVPGARERGMELVGSWVTPPVEVEQGNELVLLWSLPGAETFWAMRRRSAEGAGFWKEMEAVTLARERVFMTSVEME